MNAVPANKVAWLKEIAIAFLDALEAAPFSVMVGYKFKPQDVFHFAPVISLKMRGIKRNKADMKKATDAALVSHVANSEAKGQILDDPILGFSFAYLASHWGLGLLTEQQVNEIMCYVEQHKERLMGYVKKGKTPN